MLNVFIFFLASSLSFLFPCLTGYPRRQFFHNCMRFIARVG
jgi:hypothetical protein